MAGAAAVIKRAATKKGKRSTPKSRRYTSNADAQVRIGLNGSGTFANVPGAATLGRR